KHTDPSKSLSATIWLLKRKQCPHLKKSKRPHQRLFQMSEKTNYNFCSTTQVTFDTFQFSAIAMVFLKRNQ
ncbi:hypothetical protein PHAVU_002G277700, partial [Phaseolus vulgaris]